MNIKHLTQWIQIHPRHYCHSGHTGHTSLYWSSLCYDGTYISGEQGLTDTAHVQGSKLSTSLLHSSKPLNFAVQPSTKTLWKHSVPTLSCYQSHPHRAAPHKQVWPCADLPGQLKNAKGGRGRASIIIGHSPESEVPSAPTPCPPCLWG